MWGEITCFFSCLPITSSRSVSYFHPAMAAVVFLSGTERVRIIRIHENNLRVIRRGGQSTNIFFIGNRYGIWRRIRSIAGYFIWEDIIINGNGRDIQSWDTTIICKGIIEAVTNCPSSLLSCCNFLVLALL